MNNSRSSRMTLDIQNTADAVARIMELDAKRLRAELTHEDNVATLDNLIVSTSLNRDLLDVIPVMGYCLRVTWDSTMWWGRTVPREGFKRIGLAGHYFRQAYPRPSGGFE